MEEVPIRPAATVILVRDGASGLETLLLRRAAALVFHGGAWVFPGGRLDPVDYDGAVVPPDPTDAGHEAAARRAAVREALEEAALVIDPTALIPFSHWTTPVGRPRRFATWFYLVEAPDEPIAVDGNEITEHRWIAPAEALRLQEANELELPPPTYFTLQRLSGCRSVADAVHEARSGEYTVFGGR